MNIFEDLPQSNQPLFTLEQQERIDNCIRFYQKNEIDVTQFVFKIIEIAGTTKVPKIS